MELLIPSRLTPAEGEKVVRQYDCFGIMSEERVEPGCLCVTNKRVIFCLETGVKRNSSRLLTEVPLDQVAGIQFFEGKTYAKTSFSRWAYLLMGLILTLLALFWFGTASLEIFSAVPKWLAPTLFGVCFVVVIAVVLLGRRIKGYSTFFRIQTKDGGSLVSFSGNQAAPSFELTLYERENVELAKLAAQLGAMLIDLKELGDEGVAKWQITYPAEPAAEGKRKKDKKNQESKEEGEEKYSELE